MKKYYNKKNQPYFKNIPILLFLLCLCSYSIQAQCSFIGSATLAGEEDDGAGNCTYSIDLYVNNPSGGGNSSVEYSVLSDGTEVAGASGCFEQISNPGRSESIEVTAPCGSAISIEFTGRTNPTCGGASCDPETIDVDSRLSVELTIFKAYYKNGNTMLEWLTETETSNDYFEIQHSNDGRTFVVIDKINGAGNSSEALVYRYQHNFPVRGINYYRLKQVDFDGTTSYSEIILNEIEIDGIVNVFPTVVNDAINVKFYEQVKEPTDIVVFNSIGQIVGSFLLEAGDNHLNIETADLDVGLYYLKIKLKGSGVITKTFVKKTL